jgi:pyruvate formate lyase activating enzyme
VTALQEGIVATLKETLDARTRVADALARPIDAGRIRCVACGHRCPIPDGAVGVCKVRGNRGGALYVPWGYVAGVQCDPIEKKPFFHVAPGALAYSFGMFGCDLHCGYCQNWVTSQALRDPEAVSPPRATDARSLVDQALALGARAVVSTYNEPLITAEWSVEVFRHARAAGLLTGFVSNGNGTPEALAFLRPWIDLYKVDLKSFDDRRYRELGGRLPPILDTIRALHDMGVWVEVVTLLVPGFNDDPAELGALTAFLAGVSPDIPWHVTAFHSDYRMDATPSTPARMLRTAADIGREAGLRFVYAGNRPGEVDSLEDTCCPSCRRTLVARTSYLVRAYDVTPDGRCPGCGTSIPGRWDRAFAPQRSAVPFHPPGPWRRQGL